MLRVLCWVLLLLTGCASTARFERDRSNSSYHAGGDRLYVTHIVPNFRRAVGDSQTMKEPLLRPEEDAVTNLVLSGIALAMNRDYYKSPYISGRAQCHSEQEPEFEVPCGNLELLFQNRETGSLQRVLAEGGEFAFEGNPGHRYTIAIGGQHYRFARPIAQPLVVGDNVVLHLMRSRRQAD